jgi:predicted RNase H-like HicB family nuclease
MEVRVEFVAKLPIKFTKKSKWVVASCPILDICAQGKTETSAKSNLKEALSLFFISCFERGTLDTVLKQCGFKPYKPVNKDRVQSAKARKSVSKKEDYINIPIPFLVDQHSQLECHA